MLTEAIAGLDVQIGTVMEKNELDFLSAYRKHMQRVQKDMEVLKKRLSEQAYLMQRSEKIAALEIELAWYKEEGLA